MTAHAEGSFVGPRRRLRVLPAEDMERIHEASLDVLEPHGAVVDRETTAARIPQAAVEEALKTLPAGFTLGGRTPEFDLPLDGEHVYLTSDGCATFVRDADGTVRPRAKQDVYDAARVVDGLHEFDACMRASRKHSIVVSIKDATEARPLIRMAEAVTGGSAELKARPTFSVILCTVSPLHQERFGMELAFALAEAGIPMMLYPMPILGATAPVTPAGAAVVNNTEILAAITAVQLVCPGAKIVHAGGPTALFMRTGAYFANVPEALLLRAVQAQMASFYGLPAGLGWGGTKAKQPEAQSAYENTLGMVLELLAGADFLFGAGLLDSVQQMSLEELVIADEVFGMVTRLVRGVTVDRENLAVDLIKKMGFKGDYLFESHTRAHVRELWQARLGETGAYDGWKAAGSPRLEDKARAVADGILAAPAPEFPEELDRAFTEIIAAAESGRF